MPAGFHRIGLTDRRSRVTCHTYRRRDHAQHTEVKNKQMRGDRQNAELSQARSHQNREQDVHCGRRHAHA